MPFGNNPVFIPKPTAFLLLAAGTSATSREGTTLVPEADSFSFIGCGLHAEYETATLTAPKPTAFLLLAAGVPRRNRAEFIGNPEADSFSFIGCG